MCSTHEQPPNEPPAIPVRILRQWINGKLIATLAEQMTIESSQPQTRIDSFRRGLDLATQTSRLETLNELSAFVVEWPDTNIDK